MSYAIFDHGTCSDEICRLRTIPADDLATSVAVGTAIPFAPDARWRVIAIAADADGMSILL
jgi:hypothetical protein